MLLSLQDTKFEGVGTKTPHNSPRNSVSVTSKFARVGTKTPHNSRRNSVSVTSKLTRVGTKTPHASLLTSNSSLTWPSSWHLFHFNDLYKNIMAPNFTPSESMSQDFFSKQTIFDNHFYKSNDKLQNNNFHPMTKSMTLTIACLCLNRFLHFRPMFYSVLITKRPLGKIDRNKIVTIADQN